MIWLGVASMFGPLQCFSNSNSSRCAATADSTALAFSRPPSSIEAASTQRTTTGENMCQGCDCIRSRTVIRSGPA